MSRALWLDMGPLGQGWGRGSRPVLLRPDSLLQPHFESLLCGAVGMGDANLANRRRMEWTHSSEWGGERG